MSIDMQMSFGKPVLLGRAKSDVAVIPQYEQGYEAVLAALALHTD